MNHPVLAFIGGGNMASAIIGGLLESGHPLDRLIVVEPFAPQRAKLAADFGLQALAEAEASLASAELLLWAVKPQMFVDAAAACAPYATQALHLSVMAGIRSDALLGACGAARIVRAMPNTPALIGRGIAGLYARPEVSDKDKQLVERVLAPTGELMWLQRESDLDAVTALSGSGPAYFFYFVEAMMDAAVEMGLSAEQGRQLALATCAGAAALAQQSPESPATLRERVTSKGGTTYAALSSLQADGVGPAIQRAVKAAQERARELGDEFGKA